MERIEHLNKLIKEANSLLMQLEGKLIYESNPLEERKLKSEIKRTKELLRENEEELTRITQESIKSKTQPTLVSLGEEIIFKGFWISARNNIWEFEVKEFIKGNLRLLKEFSIEEARNRHNDYILVEDQGDGRQLDGSFSWKNNDGKYTIEVVVQKRHTREDAYKVGSDIAIGGDGDLVIENGDLKIVSGLESAKQSIFLTLNAKLGSWRQFPTFGSQITNLYKKYKNSLELNRVLKLEIIKLISIPIIYFDDIPLSFVNRIIDVQVIEREKEQQAIKIKLKIEWKNDDIWEGGFTIYL